MYSVDPYKELQSSSSYLNSRPHNLQHSYVGPQFDLGLCWCMITLIYVFAYRCRLLIIFTNSLDPDQAQHNVGPDLVLNCLTLYYGDLIFLKEFFENVNFEKTQ